MIYGQPKSDIQLRKSLGHTNALVSFMTIDAMQLITTGSHDQMVALAERLNSARNGKGPIYLNRSI